MADAVADGLGAYAATRGRAPFGGADPLPNTPPPSLNAMIRPMARRLSRINILCLELLADDLADTLPRHAEVLRETGLQAPPPARARHPAPYEDAGRDAQFFRSG